MREKTTRATTISIGVLPAPSSQNTGEQTPNDVGADDGDEPVAGGVLLRF